MRWLASAEALVATTVLLALGSHPALDLSGRWPAFVPAVAFVWVACLLARAEGHWPRQLLAVGAALALSALAYDAVRGVEGSLELAPGEATTRFTETGPDGRPLGLRPLDFSLRLEGVDPDGGARLSVARPDGTTATASLAPRRSLRAGAFRFAPRGWSATRGPALLRLAIVTGGATHEAELATGVSTRVADLEIAVEQYFPDFALDAQRQPFSRSDEPRNPGALLRVKRGAQEFRVFVLQALPGIHTQEGLDASFSLAGVEAARPLRIDVTASPAAAGVAAGAVLALVGFVTSLRTSPAGTSLRSGALGGLGLAAILAQVDAGSVLRWRFEGVPVAGGLLGLALLAGLAAALLLALGHPVGRHALLLAAACAAVGTAAAWIEGGVSRSLVAVAAASGFAGLAGAALSWRVGAAARLWSAFVDLARPAFAIAALAAGWHAWQQTGAYDAPAARAALAAALLGLAAGEPVGLARVAIVLFVGAGSWLLAS